MPVSGTDTIFAPSGQIAGMLVATLVTLVIVPVLYVIFVEDLHLVRWETESTKHEVVSDAGSGMPHDQAVLAASVPANAGTPPEANPMSKPAERNPVANEHATAKSLGDDKPAHGN